MHSMQIITLTCLIVAISSAPSIRLHPDAGLSVLELIEKHGYKYERHQVVTDDGYILEMHRIPYGRSTNRQPVLFIHGLTSSSADWVNIGVNRSLAYRLADLGYDIWLGNFRGNEWGRKHVTLDVEKDKVAFFNYSYHEHGVYDLPAMIDHILNVTESDKLQYVGFSQGTSSFFAMAAERPEYNEKISLMTALAPIAYMKNLPNPFIQLLSQFEESAEWITNNIGLHEFLPKSELIEILGKAACDDGAQTQELCTHILFLIVGYDSEQLDGNFIPVITTNTPSGSSTKEFLHYGQGIKSGLFRQYDYHTPEKNIEIYGSEEPPSYDIKKITAPIAFHYAQNDWLSSVYDAERLLDELPNVVLSNKVAFQKFNHLDFIWANDVVELLYNDVIDEILKH